MDDLPKGYDCQTCGKRHEFPAYVYAHWDMTVAHDCPKCGAEHHVLCGEAELIKAGIKERS